MDVTPALAEVAAELEPHGELVGVRELTGGVSAEVVALDIATADGGRRRVVFRRHRVGDVKQHVRTVTAKEHRLLDALHSTGFAVPEPYLYVETVAGPGSYLVMEWIDGSTELRSTEVDAALDQMARFLVELHALDPYALPIPELEPIEDPYVAVMPYLASTKIGRNVAAKLPSDRARHGSNRRALLHGDYWPGNVLWRDGRLVAVLDWEDATVGDPMADLATARVELLCHYGDDAMNSFTSRYVAHFEESIGPVQRASLPIWELYVSASALAAMGGWGLEPSDEIRRRRRTQRFFEGAAAQLSRRPPDAPAAPC